MADVRTVDGVPDGTDRSEWELLSESDPDSTVFQSPRYLEVWHRQLGGLIDAKTHLISSGGRVIGVVAEAHERHGTLTGPEESRRFLGGTEVTDYLGPIARPEDRVDVATAYLDVLADDVDWDELHVSGLAEDTGWPEIFRRQVEDRGWAIRDAAVEDVCPAVDLSGGYEGFLGALPGKQRHEMRRKARKLARDAGEVRLVEANGDRKEHLETFFEMAATTESPKAGFFRREPMRDFFRALADEFSDDRTFRLHVLEVAGRPAAATVSLCEAGRWGLYNSAFDPTLANLAPGMVLVAELIEIAAAEGYTCFDLLRGDEPYKYRFGAKDRVLQRFTVTRVAEA